MCEFCSFGPSSRRDGDATKLEFSGFYCAHLVKCIVAQSKDQRQRDDVRHGEDVDGDDDGT